MSKINALNAWREKKWGPMELDDKSSSSTTSLGKTFDVVRMYVRESIGGLG